MKRAEIFLLAALALLWGAQTALIPAPPASGGGRTSWQEQQEKTVGELRRTMATDRTMLQDKLRRDPSLWWRFQTVVFGLMLISAGVFYQWGRLLFRLLFFGGPEPPLGSPPPATWGFRQIFRIALLVLLVLQGSSLLQAILFRLFHPLWLDRRVAALADTLLVDGVAAAGACGFLFRGRGARGGLARIPAFIQFAFRSYLLAVPLLMGILAAVAVVLNLLKIQPAPQPIFTIYLSEQRTLVVRSLLLLAVVAGPVAEEIFFRGLLYGWLRQRAGIPAGLILSAFFFALLHMDAVAFFPIFGLGLLFGWVYERTGSLTAPIAIHIFHNSGMLFVASLIKGLVAQG